MFAYSYDNLGRRVSIARGNGAATSYAFDAASHAFERLRARGGLTNLTQNPAGSTYDQSWDYAFNPAGQIALQTASNSAWNWGFRV